MPEERPTLNYRTAAEDRKEARAEARRILGESFRMLTMIGGGIAATIAGVMTLIMVIVILGSDGGATEGWACAFISAAVTGLLARLAWRSAKAPGLYDP